MALLDISLITEALVKLLELHIHSSAAWTSQKKPNIRTIPADQLEEDGLGFYLYHITEDSGYKNLPPPGADEPGVRYSPMGLNLYYQLYAHTTKKDNKSAYAAQRLLGLAVKALHDFPIVTDDTQLREKSTNKDVKILEEVGLAESDNSFRLSLEPVSHNDAVSFWSAGTTPLRLAAYYQVTVVLLEPEETRKRAARVLDYGVHTFVGGAPRLDGNENTLEFLDPGSGDKRALNLRPAEVPVGSSVSFTGTDLAGDETHLLLQYSGWKDPGKPRQADAAWGVKAASDRILATVEQAIDGEPIIPGIHSAKARVVRQRKMPDGSLRRFEQTSNATPFTITPQVKDIKPKEPPYPGEIVTVNGYTFKQPVPNAPALDVQVYLGPTGLNLSSAVPLKRGEFRVKNGSTLELRLPKELKAGDVLPLRILVNGAESAPNWIKV